MKLQYFETLQDAIDYPSPDLQQKMVSGSQMKAFVVGLGMYEFFKNATNGMHMATYDEMSSPNGEFNFMIGHPSAITDMMDLMESQASTTETFTMLDGNTITHQNAFATLKQLCVNHANRTVYPYKNTTQEEFDLAKSLQDTPALQVTYTNGQNVENPNDCYHVTAGFRKTKFFVYLEEAATTDTVVNIYVRQRPSEEFAFTPPVKIHQVTVLAGELSALAETTQTFTIKCQFETLCNYNRPHRLVVAGA